MSTVEQYQVKQDAINKAKFQINIIKNVLWSTDDKNMKVVLDGSIEALEELISVTDNEGPGWALLASKANFSVSFLILFDIFCKSNITFFCFLIL